jgi:PIN domain nuclease of toxin-antitoxin system
MGARDRIVLDTHVWKIILGGDHVGRRALARIDEAASIGSLYIAAITVWEIATLVREGTFRVNAPTMGWITTAIHSSRVIVCPLDPAIAVDAAELSGFLGDPADRMIVATARHLGALLITRDAKILAYAAQTKNVLVLDPS